MYSFQPTLLLRTNKIKKYNIFFYKFKNVKMKMLVYKKLLFSNNLQLMLYNN